MPTVHMTIFPFFKFSQEFVAIFFVTSQIPPTFTMKVIQSVHIINYHNIVSASALGYIKHMNYLWLLKGQHMLSYQFTTNHLTLLTSAVHKTQQCDEEEIMILK